MSLYIKSRLSVILRNLLHRKFKLAVMNMVKVVNKWLSNFALKFVIFN